MACDFLWGNPKLWPNDWPDDSSEYVFLARAAHEIGRAMFGEEWSGKEPLQNTQSSLPASLGLADDLARGRALELLEDHRPDLLSTDRSVINSPYGPTIVTSSLLPPTGLSGQQDERHKEILGGKGLLGFGDDRGSGLLGGMPIAPISLQPPSISFATPRSELTEAEWDAAQAIVARLNNEARPGVERFARVKQEIVRRCRSGELVTALRSLLGGELSPPIDRSQWNTERVHQRFCWCRMHPDEPFRMGDTGPGYQWIYVTRESLDRFVTSLSATDVSNSVPTASDNWTMDAGAGQASNLDARAAKDADGCKLTEDEPRPAIRPGRSPQDDERLLKRIPYIVEKATEFLLSPTMGPMFRHPNGDANLSRLARDLPLRDSAIKGWGLDERTICKFLAGSYGPQTRLRLPGLPAEIRFGHHRKSQNISD